MFRTPPHRQVVLAVGLVTLALTGTVAATAVAQTDVSTIGTDTQAVESGVPDDASTDARTLNESNVSVTLKTPDSPDDLLVLRAAPNQTVRVESNAPAGTEISVTLRSAESNFLRSRQATVSEDGTGTVTFDMSDVASKASFTATADADAGTEVEGIVLSESVTVEEDAAFAPDEPASNYTVRGWTDDLAAEKLDVRVASTGSSFSANETVTVGEDGTFAATFDLSSVDAGTELAIELGGIPREVTPVVATDESGSPTVFALVETPANATIRYPEETLLVHSAANQTVRGTTNLRPGTEITVKAVRNEPNSPKNFARTANATIREDGTFAAKLNFSGVEPGTEFSVRVGPGLTTKQGRVVDESVTLPTVTRTEQNVTTKTGDTPDVPGFGASVALVALLAGLALARRV